MCTSLDSGGKTFLLLQSVTIDSGAHPIPCFVESGMFLRETSGRGRLRKRGVTPLTVSTFTLSGEILSEI
jgi:hypothetical protein